MSRSYEVPPLFGVAGKSEIHLCLVQVSFLLPDDSCDTNLNVLCVRVFCRPGEISWDSIRVCIVGDEVLWGGTHKRYLVWCSESSNTKQLRTKVGRSKRIRYPRRPIRYFKRWALTCTITRSYRWLLLVETWVLIFWPLLTCLTGFEPDLWSLCSPKHTISISSSDVGRFTLFVAALMSLSTVTWWQDTSTMWGEVGTGSYCGAHFSILMIVRDLASESGKG